MIRHAYPSLTAKRKNRVPAFAGMSGTYCFGFGRPDPIIPYNARQ
jgi:hypothetical protein